MSRALEGLYRRLEPLKLYALRRGAGTREDPGSLIDCELAAYGAGFAKLEELLEEILRQAFVQTAEGEGLLLHEKLVGLQERPEDSSSLANRRELVLYRLAVAPFDFHLEGMHSSVRAAGIDAVITEHFTEEYLTVRSRRLIDQYLDTSAARDRLEAMLPAHLDFDFDFGELTWNMFEKAGTDWNRWDAMDFTWEEFDLEGHLLFEGGGND